MKVLRFLNVIQLIVFMTLIISVLAVVMAPDYFIVKYASYLVDNIDRVPSDAVVVISGNDDWLRRKEGYRLFQAGYGEVLIFSGYPGNHDHIFKEADDLGIDRDLLIFDEKASSTYENALYTKEIVDARGYDSFVVVTSPPQSKRARMVYEKVCDSYDISIAYSSDHIYDPEFIFENKGIRENFSNEGIKYVYYLVKYGIR